MPKRVEENKGVVLAEGFLLEVSLPSEGLYLKRFNDEEPIIDEVKKEVPLLPDSLTSGFKLLRNRMYTVILPEHTFKIQKVQNRALYFLPFSEVPAFMRDVEELKERYRDLQREIQEYIDGSEEYKQKVQRYFKEKFNQEVYSANEVVPDLAARVKIGMTPVSLAPHVWKKWIDDKAKEVFSEIDKVKEEGIRRVHEEIEKQRKEILHMTISNVHERVLEIMQKITELLVKGSFNKKSLQMIERMLSTLNRLSSAIQYDISKDPFNRAVKVLLDAMAEKREAEITAIVQRLAEEYGVSIGKSDAETMNHIAKKYRGRIEAVLKDVTGF